MYKRTFRVVAMLLAVVMVLGMLPAAVFAAEDTTEPIESTESDPSAVDPPEEPPAEETTDPPGESEMESSEVVTESEDIESSEEAEDFYDEDYDPYLEKYGISMEEIFEWLSGERHSESEEPEDLYKANENNPYGLDIPDGLTEAEWYEILADFLQMTTFAAPTGVSMGPEFQIFSGRWAIKGYTSGGLGDYATVYYQGKQKTIKQYSFKYMRDSAGKYYAPYCIDPPADFADSGYTATEYTYSGAWYNRFNMSAAQAQAITLAMLYGSPNGFSTSRGTAQYYAERAATQTIIWEILCQSSSGGAYLRSSTAPYTQNSNAIYKTFAKSTMYYNGGSPIPSADMCNSVGGDLFATAYNTIAQRMAEHGKTPSFASDRMGNAPSYKLTRNTNGTYSITLTDTNGVLNKCKFTNGNGITYSVSGNNLTITVASYDQVPSAAISIPMSYPNFETEPILIWEKGNMQAFASLGIGRNDPVPCYFSLTADLPYGDLEIVKTTNTGSSLSGWVFDIFSGKTASGNPVKTVTSGADGKIAANDLTPGWYTVVERSVDGWVCDTAKTVEVKAGEKASVSFSNTQLGKLQITKSTNTGSSLAGWVFDIYSGETASGNPVKTVTSGTNGNISVSDLTPGWYTIAERSVDGWLCDSAKTVEVKAGQTASVSFYNAQLGKIGVQKKTNISDYGGSWTFHVYEKNTNTKVATISTNATTGYAETGWLAPGDYVIYEDNSSAASYPQWVYDTSGHNVTVTSGNTVNTEITNTHLGRFEIYKSTNTGKDLGNWEFDVYAGANASGNPIATLKTDAKGYAISGWLQAGTYTIKERAKDGWICDTTPQTVTVSAGTTIPAGAKATFSNTQMGKISVQKKTNVDFLGGTWKFNVYLNGTLVTTITTDANTGYGESGWLAPGDYVIYEDNSSASSYPQWVYDTSGHSVTVTSGATAKVEVTNTHLGRFEIYKSTNTGADLGNWEFDVYSGSNVSGNPIATLKTDANGHAISGWLQAGTYTIVEHSYDGWQCDTTPKTVTVVAGTAIPASAKANFANTQMGKAEIMKAFATMEPSGSNPVAGWQFTLKSEKDGTVYGPYSTDSKGKVTTGWLLPGWYSVCEIIPEGSLYTAKTNPQRIEIKPGTTAQTSITFTNALKPAKLTIHKVDPSGSPLAGAKFLLEWSKDNGATWNTITRNTAENVVVGGCSSSVADGYLTTDSSGIIEFTGLHPMLRYRLTEVEAPDGYQLLSDRAWEGTLDTQKELSLTLTVHNYPGYELPSTGTNNDPWIIAGAFFAALMVAIGAVMLTGTIHFDVFGNANHKYMKSKED